MGNVMIADVVGFGSARLDPLLDHMIVQRGNAPSIRDLPRVQIHQADGNQPVNPWVQDDHVLVCIPAVDLYHQVGFPGGGELPAPVPAADLDIDLWCAFRIILATARF